MTFSNKENLQQEKTKIKCTNTLLEDTCHNNKLFPNIPKVSMRMAIIILILNTIFPGMGTILLGCFLPHDFTNEEGVVCCSMALVGLMQLILAILLIGWIWSIAFGVYILYSSYNKKDDKEN